MRNWRGHPASASGYELVERPLYCVLTRVRLRHLWALPRMVQLYLWVWRDAKQVPHLKRCAFLLHSPRTFFILSIWDSEAGFVEFGTQVEPHLTAARQSLARAARASGNSRRPAIWSTEWQLRAVSHNLDWGDPLDWAGLWRDRIEPVASAESTHRTDEDSRDDGSVDSA